MVGVQTIVVKPRAILRKYWAIWSQSSGSLDAGETGLLSIYVLRLHSLPELCLAQVIGDMRRSAEYNGEPIAMRLPQEILFRHSAMLLEPGGDRQLRKACPQNLTGLLPNKFQILALQYGWNSPIWVRHEH